MKLTSNSSSNNNRNSDANIFQADEPLSLNPLLIPFNLQSLVLSTRSVIVSNNVSKPLHQAAQLSFGVEDLPVDRRQVHLSHSQELVLL